jgi:hypothetical protein
MAQPPTRTIAGVRLGHRGTRRTTIEASSVDVDVDFVVDVELIVERVAVHVRKAEREREREQLWRLG